ncbi:MAG: hypothetical protein ACRD0H_10805 [Actinomycetes bacterium]
MDRHRTRRTLARPGAGHAVLACRCGTVLDLADLHRMHCPPGPRSGFCIEPIGCRTCAAGAR